MLLSAFTRARLLNVRCMVLKCTFVKVVSCRTYNNMWLGELSAAFGSTAMTEGPPIWCGER